MNDSNRDNNSINENAENEATQEPVETGITLQIRRVRTSIKAGLVTELDEASPRWPGQGW